MRRSSSSRSARSRFSPTDRGSAARSTTALATLLSIESVSFVVAHRWDLQPVCPVSPPRDLLGGLTDNGSRGFQPRSPMYAYGVYSRLKMFQAGFLVGAAAIWPRPRP